MKKQNKVLKLKKSTISELNIERTGEIIGGKTGAEVHCVSILEYVSVATTGC